MQFDPSTQLLLLCGIAARAAVVLRISSLGTRWRYSAFGLFALAGAAFSATVLAVNFTAAGYYAFWRASEIALLVLSIAAGIEAYVMSARRFWRVGSLESSVVLIGAGLGAIAGYASLSAISEHISGVASQSAVLAAKQFASLSLAVFVGATSLMFSLQPVPEARNSIVHRWVLAAYLALDAAVKGAVLMGLPPQIATWIGLSLSAGCLVVWTRLISKKGELRPAGPTEAEATQAAETLIQLAVMRKAAVLADRRAVNARF